MPKCDLLDDLSSTLAFVTDGFEHRTNAECSPNTAGQVTRRAPGGAPDTIQELAVVENNNSMAFL